MVLDGSVTHMVHPVLLNKQHNGLIKTVESRREADVNCDHFLMRVN